MGKKIGIMGGSFNPIHNGHLLLAEEARESLGLDEIMFIPCGNPYMKDAASILNGEARFEMVELAIKENPYFYASKIELIRKGATYTCETLAELKKNDRNSDYYFILGTDALFSIESWKNPEFILQNSIIAVALRGNETEQETRTMAEQLKQKYKADIRILPARYIDISSSDIRLRIKTGKSIRYMIPDKVLAYITEKGLYTI